MSICMIDDSNSDALVVRDNLAVAGYSISHYISGAKFIEHIRNSKTDESHPTLLIVDLLMPEQDGIETIRELRTLLLSTPIIIASAGKELHLQSAGKLAREWGFDVIDVMRKPIDFPKLLDHVKRLGINT